MGAKGSRRDGHTRVHGDLEKCVNTVKETETERGVWGRQRRRNELAQGGDKEEEGSVDGQRQDRRTEGGAGRRKEREGAQERPTQRRERKEMQTDSEKPEVETDQGWKTPRSQRSGPCGPFGGAQMLPRVTLLGTMWDRGSGVPQDRGWAGKGRPLVGDSNPEAAVGLSRNSISHPIGGTYLS